jgi:hypothetical protein
VKWTLWGASLLAMYWRAPALLAHPRFWAEEGSLYFAYAFDHSWYEALVKPYAGYFSLYVNCATLAAARFVTLPNAPLLTTIAAFLVQAISPAIIVWSQSELWRGTARKLAGLLIVLLAPLWGELWLNTINSQFFWSLTAFLILLEPVRQTTTIKRRVYCVALLIAGLTGVVSCFLAPLFVLKAWWERTRESIGHAAILLVCFAVQGAIAWSLRNEPGVAHRLGVLNPPTLASIVWTNTVAWPLFGFDVARGFARLLYTALGTSGFQFTLIGVLLLLLELVFLWYVSSRVDRRLRWLLLGTYGLLTVLSAVFSGGSRPEKTALISPGYGGRYFYVPNVALLILLLANVRWPTEPRFDHRSVVCAGLLAAALFFGARRYWEIPTAGAEWTVEVAQWRANPTHRLRIWPQGWSVTLSKH